MSRPDYDEGTRLLFSETTSLVGAFIASALAFTGTIGNLVTICALLQSRLRSHPTSLCLVALAASDLVFCVYNLPLTAYQYFHRGCDYSCLDWRLCIYIPFFYYGNIGVSLFIMTLIAVHRVLGVFYGHIINKYFTKMFVLFLLAICFLLSFGPLHLPLTHNWGQFGFEPQSISCTLLESQGSSFLPVMAVFGVGLPSIIIFASYAAIYYKVRATGRRTREAARAGDSDLGVGNYSVVGQTKQREKSLTVTFSTIFVAFVVCFIPWCILSVLDPIPTPFDEPPSQYGSLHMVTYILTWLSACVNPIIYCLTNKHYREAHLAFVRSLFCPLRQANNQTSFTESTNLSLPLKKKISSQGGVTVQINDAPITERHKEDKIFNHVGAGKPELKDGVKSKYSDGHYDTRGHTKELEDTRIHLSGSLQGTVRKLEDVD